MASTKTSISQEQLDLWLSRQPAEGPLTCQSCKRLMVRKQFAIVARNPVIYHPTCIACRAQEQAEELRKQVIEQHQGKAIRSAIKQVASIRKTAVAARRKQTKRQQRDRENLREREKRAKANAEKRLAQEEDETKKELYSRVLARRSLLHYIERSMPEYMAGWVHEDICRRLEKFVEDVEKQRSPRLMLLLPPRHGKSEIASVRFPEWVLGKHPEWEFIATSYSLDLPLSFSRRIRARLGEDSYHAVFPHTFVSKDATSAEMWRTSTGGGYRAAGVGGGITGMGAHILLVDDPIKDQEEADSETIREKIHSWFTTTAYTRLAPGGGALIVQTKWHDDDLAGRLERQMVEHEKERAEERQEIDALYNALRKTEADERFHLWKKGEAEYDRWEIVRYPATAETDEFYDPRTGRITASDPHAGKQLRKKGDPLHPVRFNAAQLAKIKRTLQPRHWSALYQQNPVPDEGLFFTKDMFRFVPQVPDHREMYKFVAWDLAVGLRNTNDWTVGVVGALDWNDDLYIIDVIRARWPLLQVANAVIDTHVKYEATLTGIEKGVLELALKPQLQRRMQERRQYITLAEGDSALKPVNDKLVRARPLQGRLQQGKVLLPANQPWVDMLQQEFLRFPGGLHDDIVDSTAWLVRMILGHGPPPEPKKAVKFKSWRDNLPKFVADNRRRHWMGA